MVNFILKKQIKSQKQISQKQTSSDLLSYSNNTLLNCFNASTDEYMVIMDSSNIKQFILKINKFIQSSQKQNISKDVFLMTLLKQPQKEVLQQKLSKYYKYKIIQLPQKQNITFEKLQSQIKIKNTELVIIFIQTSQLVNEEQSYLIKLNQMVKKLRDQTKMNIFFCVDFSSYCNELNLSFLNEIDLCFFNPCNKLGGQQATPFFIMKKNINKLINQKSLHEQVVSKTEVTFQNIIKLYRSALCFQLLKTEISYPFINQRQQLNFKLFSGIIQQKNNFYKLSKTGKLVNLVVYPTQNEKNNNKIIYFNIISNNQLIQNKFLSLILAQMFCIFISFQNQLITNDQSKQRINSQTSHNKDIELKNENKYLKIYLPFYFEPFEIEYVINAIFFVAQQYNKTRQYDFLKDLKLKEETIKNDVAKQQYGLSNWPKIKENIRRDRLLNQILLKNKKQYLQKQLQHGKQNLKYKFAHCDESTF